MKMKILCHVGPWCTQQYRAIANAVDPKASVTLISGFKDLDETGFQKNYYSTVENKSANMFGLDENDFILRCRLLRSLPRDEALLHLYSTREAVAKVLDELKPDLVFSEVVDQFLIDLLRYECEQRSIPFYGLVVSFVNGYFRITSRGERGVIRANVKGDEVERVSNSLSNTAYTPAFVTAKSTGLRLWAKILSKLYKSNLKIPYFFAKRYISGEKYNYHYWASYISAVESFHLIPRLQLGQKASLLSCDQAQQRRLRIYIPLQMYPEATIEYWCNDLEIIEYNHTLIELVKRLSGKFEIIIKEHPNVLGGRNPKLYDELNDIKGVFLCETYANSNDLVSISDAVLVWTGSVGFEAALRGKPVLTMTEPYYMCGDRFKMIDLNTDLDEINSYIINIKNSVVEPSYMVKNLLQGLALGRYKNDHSWSSNDRDDQVDAQNIGKAIADAFYSSHIVD
jgi:hypothetical protein